MNNFGGEQEEKNKQMQSIGVKKVDYPSKVLLSV